MRPASRDPLPQMLENLRRMLGEAFALQGRGSSGNTLGRAYGAADGYMLALVDAGLTTPRELCALVAEERIKLLGPGSREIAPADVTLDGELAA